jgi:thioredoxin 1
MDKEIEAIKEKKLREMKMKAEAKEPLQLTDAEFENVIGKNDLVVVDFWAPWCGPCRMIAPIMEELAKALSGKAVIAKVNVDENQIVPQKFGIMGIPTILIFKKGKLVDKIVGYVPKEHLEGKIQAQLK